MPPDVAVSIYGIHCILQSTDQVTTHLQRLIENRLSKDIVHIVGKILRPWLDVSCCFHVPSKKHYWEKSQFPCIDTNISCLDDPLPFTGFILTQTYTIVMLSYHVFCSNLDRMH